MNISIVQLGCSFLGRQRGMDLLRPRMKSRISDAENWCDIRSASFYGEPHHSSRVESVEEQHDEADNRTKCLNTYPEYFWSSKNLSVIASSAYHALFSIEVPLLRSSPKLSRAFEVRRYSAAIAYFASLPVECSSLLRAGRATDEAVYVRWVSTIPHILAVQGWQADDHVSLPYPR